MNKIKLNLEIEINERWVNPFLSMLKRMQCNSNIGHSEIVGLFADGDGDFYFNFKTDKNDYDYIYPLPNKAINSEMIYDADYNVKNNKDFINDVLNKL